MEKEEAICVDITGAQTHDSKPVEKMMNFLNLRGIERFVADKAYGTKSEIFCKKTIFMLKFQIKRTGKILLDLTKLFTNGDIVSKIFFKN
jgi:hypothetical protein